jgi:hypothetical protein
MDRRVIPDLPDPLHTARASLKHSDRLKIACERQGERALLNLKFYGEDADIKDQGWLRPKKVGTVG